MVELIQELGTISAGSTVPVKVSPSGYDRFTVQYTVTGISGTLVVQVEGSIDNVNYFNLDENGSTSLTSNGVYALSDFIPVKWIRFTIVSGTGTVESVLMSTY